MDAIRIPVAFGELVDKLTILEIKAERIGDPLQRANVDRELQALRAAWNQRFPEGYGAAGALAARLKDVNLALWTIEDEIRDCERRKDFGARFVRLARSVYVTNDERAALKREINQILGSPLREEKSYKPYGSGPAGEDRTRRAPGPGKSDDTSTFAAGPAVGRRDES